MLVQKLVLPKPENTFLVSFSVFGNKKLHSRSFLLSSVWDYGDGGKVWVMEKAANDKLWYFVQLIYTETGHLNAKLFIIGTLWSRYSQASLFGAKFE